VTEIGLSLYLDMLEHAVQALKAGREPVLDQPLAAATEVELRLPAFLPEVYVGDVHMRLSLYKRIAAADSNAALDDLSAEIHDRFGPLPPVAQSLLRIAKLKLAARALECAGSIWERRAARCCFESAPASIRAPWYAYPDRRTRVPPRRTAEASRVATTAHRERPFRVCRGSSAAPRRGAPAPLECRAWTPASRRCA